MKTFATAFAITLLATTAYARGHHHVRCNHAHHHSSHHTRRHSDDITSSILVGQLELDGHLFDFVSGGRGRGHIPFGDYEITPEDVGPWGARHGALGLNHGDDIPDPRFKTARDGIEIHAAERHTAGCVGIKEGFDHFKRLVKEMIDKAGAAWLHIRPDKQTVTASKGEITNDMDR